jgi:protoporphyrinogen/coproporphyrinogen III oxidase
MTMADRENISLEGDESAGAFAARMLGGNRELVDKHLSAMFHGIYGGDVWKLSARQTILENFWLQDQYPIPRDTAGDVFVSVHDKDLYWNMLCQRNTNAILELALAAKHHNLMAFEDGLVTLVESMVEDLKQQSNVTISCGTPVKSLRHTGSGVEVCAAHS